MLLDDVVNHHWGVKLGNDHEQIIKQAVKIADDVDRSDHSYQSFIEVKENTQMRMIMKQDDHLTLVKQYEQFKKEQEEKEECDEKKADEEEEKRKKKEKE